MMKLNVSAAAGFALVLAFLTWNAVSAMAEQGVRVRGTTVTLNAPDTFVNANEFAGLESQELSGTIVVTELPKEAYAPTFALFSNLQQTNARLASQGIKMVSIEQLQTDRGVTVPLLHGTQEGVGGIFDKWMAVFPGDRTAIVTLQIQKKNTLGPAIIRKVFASVHLGEAPSKDEQLTALPFALNVIEPFRFVGSPSGAGALLTVGPQDLNIGNRQPIIIVVRQVSPVALEGLELMAETQLRSTSSFRGAEIQSRRGIEFVESRGVFLEGVTKVDGVTLEFSQYFSIARDGRFIRLVAAAPHGQMSALVPTVEKIAHSVKLK